MRGDTHRRRHNIISNNTQHQITSIKEEIKEPQTKETEKNTEEIQEKENKNSSNSASLNIENLLSEAQNKINSITNTTSAPKQNVDPLQEVYESIELENIKTKLYDDNILINGKIKK